jgi:hypothetical protein
LYYIPFYRSGTMYVNCPDTWTTTPAAGTSLPRPASMTQCAGSITQRHRQNIMPTSLSRNSLAQPCFPCVVGITAVSGQFVLSGRPDNT